jgi:hypothetical protein
MSDLAAPLLAVLGDEADAWAALSHLLAPGAQGGWGYGARFGAGLEGMGRQLAGLRRLVQVRRGEGEPGRGRAVAEPTLQWGGARTSWWMGGVAGAASIGGGTCGVQGGSTAGPGPALTALTALTALIRPPLPAAAGSSAARLLR